MSCDSILKCFILVINTILFALGVCLAALAGYTAINGGSVLHTIITEVDIPGARAGLYCLMAVGIVMAVVSFLGCVGASNENRLLLWFNFSFVLLLLIMQVVAVILCFYKYKVVEKDLVDVIRESPGSRSSDAVRLLRKALAFIEKEKKCCGLNGPKDYVLHNIPDSCRPLTNPATDWSSRKILDTFAERGGSEFGNEMKPEEPLWSSTDKTSLVSSSTGSEARIYATTASQKSSSSALSEHTTSIVTSNPSSSKPHQYTPYTKGCIDFLKPVIYAAGGIGIGVLLLELLLLICIGWLLREIGNSYESLA